MTSSTSLSEFCRNIPKIELHAHLNGSLSLATMLELKRLNADFGIKDSTNAFFDEFQIGTGDTKNISDCFQVFSVAHNLTTTPKALALATTLTLQEFQNDGCCYIELRSTPRDTPYMSKKVYVKTLVDAIKKASDHLTMHCRLIISIDRRLSFKAAEEIVTLTIEYHSQFPEIIVGIELSGDPSVGYFKDFVPLFLQARDAGLKITLHCGEVANPQEVKEMLEFKPERIGHGVCIHPAYGGSNDLWLLLCQLKIPVEICLSSNVKTKLIPDYDSHHLKELYDANIPIVICTDDKGVFGTSLSQEYIISMETFGLNRSQITDLVLKSCNYTFSDDIEEVLKKKILSFTEI